ncbi:MAG: hypothetical protein ACRD44_15230 [Bryobacteraceae bacterium]
MLKASCLGDDPRTLRGFVFQATRVEAFVNAWPNTLPLASPEGELKAVRITVDARMLEDLLEALAELSFPINPQIHHQLPAREDAVSARPVTMVEFPAYESRLEEVRAALDRAGFPAATLSVTGILEGLRRPPVQE